MPKDPTPKPFTSPESYTPKHLVELILKSKGAREGEHKQVTVLFADVKKSMKEMLSDRDPEEACKLLKAVRTDEGRGSPLRGHRQ